MERMFYGPLWPMPKITITAAGTGKAITSGLTNPTTSGVQTSEYFEAAAKAIISNCPSGNTGDMYLVTKFSDGTFKRTNAGTVVQIIPKGTTRQFPEAEYGSNRYDMTQLGYDADNNNDVVYPVGIMQ